MRWLVLLLLGSQVASATELAIFTRDGVVHFLKDGLETAKSEEFSHPQALAVGSATELYVLADGIVTVLQSGKKPKRLKGKFSQLAGRGHVFAVDGKGVLGEVAGGEFQIRGAALTGRFFTGVGESMVVEQKGSVLDGDRKFPVQGHPIALALTEKRIYVATKEGPLWIIDRATGMQRELVFGNWWNVIDMSAYEDRLYIITSSGKLWEIAPDVPEKHALAMSGWESAYTIAVLR